MDKIRIRKKAKLLKTQKLFIKLLILVIISIILGILYMAILSKSNKELINTTLNNFFSEINNGKINYKTSFINSFFAYTLSGLFIWILGISIIGIPLILIFLFYKSFILGFSFTSLIYFYKVKGIIASFIYLIPLILSLGILIILSFFAIRYSKRLMRVIFYKQDYSLKRYTTRYLKILLVSEVLLVIVSLSETFLVPYLLKFIAL